MNLIINKMKLNEKSDEIFDKLGIKLVYNQGFGDIPSLEDNSYSLIFKCVGTLFLE